MARHQRAPLQALPKDPKGMPHVVPPTRGSIGPPTRTPSEVLGRSEAAALRVLLLPGAPASGGKRER